MKDGLKYFSHDSSATSHPKMKALRSRYGWDGYGRFWALNEMIASAPKARLDLSRKINKMAAADDLGMTVEEFEAFIDFLADPEIDLINREDGIIWTDMTAENYDHAEAERDRKRTGGKASAEKRNNSAEKPDNSTEVPRNIPTNETKLNETKLNKSKEEQESSDSAGEGIQPCTPAAEIVEEAKNHGAVLTTETTAALVRRFHDLGLDRGFVNYAFARSAKAEVPQRYAVKGMLEYDNWAEEYKLKAKPKAKSREPTLTCEKCGSTAIIRTDTERICSHCKAAWEQNKKTGSWEFSQAYQA
jgi:hypothetical protein